jgi:hypothetical protein
VTYFEANARRKLVFACAWSLKMGRLGYKLKNSFQLWLHSFVFLCEEKMKISMILHEVV